MLKNIEKLREKGVKIKAQYLVPELYSYKVPLVLLKQLALKSVSEETPTKVKSRLQSIETS